jgi:cation/acetate symporter
MSAQAWTYILVTITFMVYLYIGWWSRVRETRGFYVAGQGVPPLANGAATAADWMSAASFISMAGLISFMGYDGSIYLMGWTGGYVLLALLIAPYLRKFGKYTVPDFVGDRYYSDTARVVAVICAIFVSLTYVAGQMRGVGIVFSRFLEVDITAGVVIGMIIVAFFAVLGGMKGITWTQVAQYSVLIVAFMIPAGAIAFKLTGNPVPQLSFTFSDIVPKLNALQADLGFAEYTQPFANKSALDVFLITVALMVGTAGLPHVIVRFYTVPTVRAARWSAGWALLFIALLYTTAPALAVFARYNLLNTLHGAEIEKIETSTENRQIYHLLEKTNTTENRSIDWAYNWQLTGLLKFADINADGIIQMTADKKTSEITIDRDIIVLSTPEVARLSPWVIALVAAGGLAAALSTAAGLLLVISSSIAHDIYFRLINPKASEQKRVQMGRFMVIIAVCVAGFFGIHPMGFVAQVVAFAFGLAAASFFPIIILGIFDKRTNREGAITGMITGLGFVAIYIMLVRSHKIFGMDEALMDEWVILGNQKISAEGVGTIGMILNFGVTWTISHLTKPPPQKIQDMVESLRHPDHPGTAVFLDEDLVGRDD